jgi:hypothetical protein
VIDYNTDDKVQDRTPQPYRASDHDPVVISLNLQPPYADVSASVDGGLVNRGQVERPEPRRGPEPASSAARRLALRFTNTSGAASPTR